MNKIIFALLIASTSADGALHLAKRLARCASHSTLRLRKPLAVTRALRTQPALRSNLPAHIAQNAAVKKQDNRANHSFETAEKPPESVRYNPERTMYMGNYRFAPFHHFATFTQQHNTGFTYIYVGSEKSIEPDSISGELSTKSITLDTKSASEHFDSLSLNLQTILKKKILEDTYFYSNGDSNAKRWSTITHILGQLNPVLRTYYENCIIDLATNKPSLSPYSVSLKRQWCNPDHDHYGVIQLTTFITAQQSTIRSLMARTVALISKAPQQLAAGVRAITSGSSSHQKHQTPVELALVPYILLQLDPSASQEQIKQAYYAKRFEAESRNDAVSVQALTDAYNKLKK